MKRACRDRLLVPAALAALCLLGIGGAQLLGAPLDGLDKEIRLNDRVVWINPRGDKVITTGTIQTELDDQIEIKTPVGTFPIKKSAIRWDETKRRRTPGIIYKEYKEKLRVTHSERERGDLHLEIGLFCVRPNVGLGGDLPMSDNAIGPERAFDHLYKAVQINPKYIQAYPYLLDLLSNGREAKGAEGGSLGEIEMEANIYMLAKAGGFEHPEIDFRLAEILGGTFGRTDEAIALYEKIIRGSGKPRNFSLERRARRCLATTYLSRGKIEEALQVYSSLLEKGTGGPQSSAPDPGRFEALYEAARIHMERGTAADRVKARDLFTKAQAIQPDVPDLARYLAALDFADGKLGLAQAKLLRLVDSGIPDPGLKVDLAIVEIQAGKFRQAMRHLNSVLGYPPEADVSPREPKEGSEPKVPAGSAPGEAPGGMAKTGADGASDGSIILKPPPEESPPGEAPKEGTEGAPKVEGKTEELVEAKSQEKTEAKIEESPEVKGDPELSRAHLARGLIFQFRRKSQRALEEFKAAYALDHSSTPAALLLASSSVGAGDTSSARSILSSMIKGRADLKGLFAAYSRVLADVEIAEGQKRKALSLLEYALGIDPGDPLLHRKVGALLLDLGELERAASNLETAQKLLSKDGKPPRDPILLNALGCYRYGKKEYEEAVKLFTQVRGLLPVPPAKEGKPPPPIPPEREYAEMALQLAQDAQRLEVWTDDFNRDSGEEVARNWREVESYGISLSVREGKLLFAGQQANDPTGVTMAIRDELGENVERLSVKLRFDPQGGRVRAGIRLESTEAKGGPPSAGLVFYRDYDGKLGISRKTTRSGWEDVVQGAEKDTGKGKAIWKGDMKWPEDGEFHTLMIRKASAASQSSQGFDLLLDGKPQVLNLIVDGLRGKIFSVGISGQAEGLGTAYRFEADDFRLYREQQLRTKEIQR